MSESAVILGQATIGWWLACVRDGGIQHDEHTLSIDIDSPIGQGVTLTLPDGAAEALRQALNVWAEQPAGGGGRRE